jgi:hypothetical protein
VAEFLELEWVLRFVADQCEDKVMDPGFTELTAR